MKQGPLDGRRSSRKSSSVLSKLEAMIEILITRPDEYESIGDGRPDEGLVPIVET